MFLNRSDAGQQLARALEKYRDTGAVVLAIPRGGVATGYEVAKHLQCCLSIIISRKLPYPYDPEAGFGAVAEDGSAFIFDYAERIVPPGEMSRIVKEQKTEAARRVKVFRKGRPLPDVRGKTVILVDDGIAMGVTMRACVMMLRKLEAGRIVAAAPVAGMDTADALEKMADELVVLEIPDDFHAVAQVYEEWYDMEDEEVLEIMEKWKKECNEGG